MIRLKRRQPRRWKPNRRERRVLLALLATPDGSMAWPLCRAAQVGSGTAYKTVARLVGQRWAVRSHEWLPGRRGRGIYTLTPEGRRVALALLGLEEKR